MLVDDKFDGTWVEPSETIVIDRADASAAGTMTHNSARPTA
jgi:hypothetical protein